MKIKTNKFYKCKNSQVVVIMGQIDYPHWQTNKTYFLAYRHPYTAHGANHPTYYEDGKATVDSEDPIDEWDIIEEVEPVHTCLAQWGCFVCKDNGRAAKDREIERRTLGCTCK